MREKESESHLGHEIGRCPQYDDNEQQDEPNEIVSIAESSPGRSKLPR